MINGRQLSRDDIRSVWTIDRSEIIDAVYYLIGGALVLKPEHYDMRGWYTPMLEACHDHGGWFYGLFDGDILVGAAVLGSGFVRTGNARLQLKFLHVGNPYRGSGLGKHLFCLARDEAGRRGAVHMYVSATPSERTVKFYLCLGCAVTREPDPELFALEPHDIHLECAVEPSG
jgi:GNAT superfamily N-acetyltransferase